MPKDDIALLFFMLHISEWIFMLYMNTIYEEWSLLQGKLDSWPSNSVYGFQGSKARTSISQSHSYTVWANYGDGKVINIILRQASLKVNRDTAVESSALLCGL